MARFGKQMETRSLLTFLPYQANLERNLPTKPLKEKFCRSGFKRKSVSVKSKEWKEHNGK